MSAPRKLTREQALAIRDSYRRYKPNMVTLAARYDVSLSMVSRILKGQHPTVLGLPDIARPKTRAYPGKWSIDSDVWVDR